MSWKMLVCALAALAAAAAASAIGPAAEVGVEAPVVDTGNAIAAQTDRER